MGEGRIFGKEGRILTWGEAEIKKENEAVVGGFLLLSVSTFREKMGKGSGSRNQRQKEENFI